MRSDVSRQQIARAAVEGVVCNLLAGADHLPAAGAVGHVRRVVLVGGGARSAAYRQVVADLIGHPVVVPEADEMVARGAAVQAAAVLAGRSPDDVIAAWGAGAATTVEPDPAVDGAAIRLAYAGVANP